jgi:serine/threonine protein kinase
VPDRENLTLDLLEALTVADAGRCEEPPELEIARRLFADFGLDTTSFLGRYGVTLETVVERLRALAPSHADHLSGLRGAALLLGEAVAISARVSAEGGAANPEELRRLTGVLRCDDVIPTLRRLYGLAGRSLPASAASRPGSRSRLLPGIHWGELEVHRIGTTSLLLSAPATFPDPKTYILKLVHFQFQDLKPIREATRGYYDAVKAAGKPDIGVEVVASGDGWVVQELIPGLTLAENMAHERARDDFDLVRDRGRLLRDVFMPVLGTLAQLQGRGVTHGDLNPSNIILQDTSAPDDHTGLGLAAGRTRVRFIDLGPNFLAAEAIGRVRSPDAEYVAPEVRKLAPDKLIPKPSADLYSLGLLLPLCLGIAPEEFRRGRIPDDLLKGSPLLARVMADLADPKADARLTTLGRGMRTRAGLGDLRKHLLELDACLTKREGEPAGGRQVAATVVKSVQVIRNPSKGLTDLSAAMSKLDLPDASEYRYLARWAKCALAAFRVILLAVALNLWARYGRGTGVEPLTWSADQLRAALSAIGVGFDPSMNSAYNQTCAVGASFAGAIYAFYRNAFELADLHRCEPRSHLAQAAEVMMRLQTVLVVPFVLVGLTLAPSTWIWLSAAGIAMVAATSAIVRQRQSEVIRHVTDRLDPADRLATAYWDGFSDPSARLWQWVPMLLYVSAGYAALGVALAVDYGEDLAIYALLVTAVNVLGFGIEQARRSADEIAPSLMRTAVLADRRRSTSRDDDAGSGNDEGRRVDGALRPAI